MEMASYASNNLNNEEELIDCVRDFRKYLNNYLLSEQDNFFRRLEELNKTRTVVNNHVLNSFNHFHEGISKSVSEEIGLKGHIGTAAKNIITFNYTSILD